jgi:hypothetical protein
MAAKSELGLSCASGGLPWPMRQRSPRFSEGLRRAYKDKHNPEGNSRRIQGENEERQHEQRP